ncbi:RNA polymerase sigma factor [Virgisporangium aurantiacum]|uniref:RNA polymerase sigma factor n=1 Tax=Virgisporangium aurantiacum TaxID=175570 RepID=A0A8J3Z8Q6_9ACTN|nr:RNA polymerase sigma factor [Virgisporangium aurantiacum]
MRDYDLTALVQASVKGDDEAWSELVRRHARLVAVTIRRFRLHPSDEQDVSQLVWLRLIESIEHIRDPAALPGWLVTTTRHECQRYVRRNGRGVVVDPQTLNALATPGEHEHDEALLAAERHRVLLDGLEELAPDHRELIELLSSDPPHTYAEISRMLDIPIGSIGPTRRRVLEKLRETTAVRTYLRSTGESRTEDLGHVAAELER